MGADFTPLVGLAAIAMAVGVFALTLAILTAPPEPPALRCHDADGTIIACQRAEGAIIVEWVTAPEFEKL